MPERISPERISPERTAAERTAAEKTIQTEKLAYWYFRLNGCLTIENFVVHPDGNDGQRTDADILGVRFPYRRELLVNPMQDEAIFQEFQKPLLFIAEVKLDECKLNGPWTKPDRRNMHRVLRALGAFPEASIDKIADNLYRLQKFENEEFEDEEYVVQLFAVGDRKNERYTRERPNVIQVDWAEILRFIHRRFRAYPNQKKDHHQWDDVGKFLWDASVARGENTFVNYIRSLLADQQGNRLTVHLPDNVFDKRVED